MRFHCPLRPMTDYVLICNEVAPKDAAILWVLQQAKGRIDRLEVAVQTWPNDLGLRIALASALQKKRKYDVAVAHWRHSLQILSIAANSADQGDQRSLLHLMLGDALYKSSDPRGAAAEWIKARDVNGSALMTVAERRLRKVKQYSNAA